MKFNYKKEKKKLQEVEIIANEIGKIYPWGALLYVQEECSKILGRIKFA